MTKKLPNFLGIGTQRAATTWLHNCLKEHPDIFVPEEKELLFFSKNQHKGMSYYASFFSDVTTEEAVGEISPEYLSCANCPHIIAKHFPDIKMIAILRNPIHRALSAYRIFNNQFTFEEAIKNKPSILDTGLYYNHLKNYFSVFNKNNFLILLYENLKKDNMATIKKVYDFLEVENTFKPSIIGQTFNAPPPFPRMSKFLETMRMAFIIDIVKESPLSPYIRRHIAKSKTLRDFHCSPATEAYLIDFYKSSNKKLQRLIDIDIKIWNNP